MTERLSEHTLANLEAAAVANDYVSVHRHEIEMLIVELRELRVENAILRDRAEIAEGRIGIDPPRGHIR